MDIVIIAFDGNFEFPRLLVSIVNIPYACSSVFVFVLAEWIMRTIDDAIMQQLLLQAADDKFKAQMWIK